MGILDVVGPDRSSVFIVGCTGPAPCAMADQSLAALLDARQTVDHALAQTRAELRRATRRAATEARHWVLPARLQNTTVAMYQLAGATEPAVKYLKTCAAERHWPDRTDIELTGLVEDMFLGAAADEIAALVDAHAPSDRQALSIAYKYVEEWKAAVWVRELNAGRGVAPTNHSLLTQIERGRVQIPVAFRASAITGERRVKRFLFRLRQRWGGQYAAIPAGEEHVGPADVRAKARHGIDKTSSTGGKIRYRNGRAWRAHLALPNHAFLLCFK